MLVVVGVMFCNDCLSAAEKELTLAEGGRSQYVIVVPENGSPSTRYGAEELQRFLHQMTGVELPIRSDQSPLSAREIVLGPNAHLQPIGVDIDFDALGAEGYRIKTKGHHLIIAGGDLRGTLYGVYCLLEDHLGCRWFTPTVSRIPKHQRLVVPSID
jgi:alpha-glucuronidase